MEYSVIFFSNIQNCISFVFIIIQNYRTDEVGGIILYKSTFIQLPQCLGLSLL